MHLGEEAAVQKMLLLYAESSMRRITGQCYQREKVLSKSKQSAQSDRTFMIAFLGYPLYSHLAMGI